MARRKAFIFAGLFLLLAFTLVVGSERWRQQSQARWVVWSDKGVAAMDFVHGRTRCTLADSAFLCDARRMDRLTGGMADIMGIRRWLVVPDSGQVMMQGLLRHGDVMQFHERRIALIRQRVRCTQQLRVDYAVITGNPRGRLRDLIGPYHTRMIVIDASNSRSKAERWRKEAVSMGIPCWSVPHDGAWVLDL
jgi:competence protein ComEC